MSDIFTCFYHPNRETRVTCGRCGRPLCPDCVRHGATGVRCKECIQLSPQERGLASPQQLRKAVLASGALAFLGGALLGWIGWLTLLPGVALGFAVGSAAYIASGRHRDIAIQAMAGAMSLLGVLLGAVVTSFAVGGPGGELGRALVSVSYYDFIAPAAAAVIGALGRFLL